MTDETLNQPTPRRGFLGMLAGGAAALGLTALVSPLSLQAQQKAATKPATPSSAAKGEADLWFDKLKGKHRVVYDAPHTHEIFPFAWPRVFLLTNEATGSPAADCGVVVVLRHEAISYAFQDRMWEKYKFAELLKAKDHGPAFQAVDAATAVYTRNPFLNTKPGDFKIPGFGEVAIGIPELQKSGVMFCVCAAAMAVYSAVAAVQHGVKHEDVLAEWKANLVPGIMPVPSGVWALGRAQEKNCAYIFAG